MQTRYEIILTAVDRGVKAAFRGIQEGATRGGKSVTAINRVMDRSQRVTSNLTQQVKGLVAAYVGFQSVSRTVDVMRQAEVAAFNLSSSVAAANREFEGTGSVEEWEDTIRRLSERLRIYSDTDLRNATSRTVDMTKRLGLSKDQMEELIARAGDLSAGKVDLEGAIERVTAALRGEAESAEYLGLTLSETYVKGVYEAGEANKKAWKTLTDLEKAQVRYQVILDQTGEFQGRAAESATTFSGAVSLVKKEIVNAIQYNKNLSGVMTELADSFRENSDELGDLVGQVISFIAKAVELAIEWKNVIFVFLGTAAASKMVYGLARAVLALKAAVMAVSSSKFIAWLGKLAAAIKVASGTAIVLAGTMGTIATLSLGAVVADLWLLYDGWKRNRESAQKLEATLDKLKKKHEEFKDVQIPGDISRLAREDLKKLNEDLHKARAYYQILRIELQEKAKETNIFGGVTNDSLIAKRELKSVEARIDALNDAIREVGDVPGMEKVPDVINATADELENFRKSAEEAYQHASDEAEKYAAKIRDLNHGIADRERDLQDRIREMRRQNMEEDIAAIDLREHALEKERAAREALAKFRESGTDRDKQLAQEMAREADKLWSDYARGGEEATTLAIRGLERVNKILDEVDKEDIAGFEKLKADAEAAMAEITKQLDTLTEARDLDVSIELKKLEDAQRKINALIKDETKTITIRTQEARAHGGRVGMANGGRFAGNSRIDSIPVMARPGEGFVRNEALSIWDRLFGTGFFEGINNPRSAAGQAIIRALKGQISIPSMPKSRPSPVMAFAAGGRVPGPGGMDLARMGTVDLNLDGSRYPVAGSRDVLEELQRAIDRKKRRRPNP